MIDPKKLVNINSITLESQLEEGKIHVIIVDGVKREAWIAEAPEHGKTLVETRKGDLARVEFEIGYKLN
ncbi:XtrA/YqaO family protein [Bacillus vallismortis]|uniref:XtrA/YqaO family protein n=1 Tax=Bacillus vallismortis TaxID=72361 RepID=A0AAP3CIE7_BACVA|nr:XtrA/YqaO family protein [Bacillus vallismortis]MBG9770135.1 phage portal protein [Bacillus vallismortis]MCI3985887.1 XtrA/YqaO family protein [Bacillus vallismortis]MCI4135772.1 XtrA/YqaO family protein [Bacillus vallismortis]MCY7894205.1 XtrA/YqaO family protein [Bacillus vallismortis]MCY7919841.1 XtrA/YqaO family protein [Bacillus vallismortis]